MEVIQAQPCPLAGYRRALASTESACVGQSPAGFLVLFFVADLGMRERALHSADSCGTPTLYTDDGTVDIDVLGFTDVTFAGV